MEHIGMPSASGSKGSNLDIDQKFIGWEMILSFKIYTILFVYIHDWKLFGSMTMGLCSLTGVTSDSWMDLSITKARLNRLYLARSNWSTLDTNKFMFILYLECLSFTLTLPYKNHGCSDIVILTPSWGGLLPTFLQGLFLVSFTNPKDLSWKVDT